MQPGPDGRAALEALDAAQDAQPCLLHDLLGDRPVMHVDEGEPDHARAVPIHERRERPLVPAAKRPEQFLLTHWVDRTANTNTRLSGSASSELAAVGSAWTSERRWFESELP
jgi:hypothetical protein